MPTMPIAIISGKVTYYNCRVALLDRIISISKKTTIGRAIEKELFKKSEVKRDLYPIMFRVELARSFSPIFIEVSDSRIDIGTRIIYN